MTAPTLTIPRHERDALYNLLARRERLFCLNPYRLAEAEGISGEQLRDEIAEERHLREDLADRETFGLMMPREALIALLGRLREDTKRALSERPDSVEPAEDEKVRKRRLESGAFTCGTLVDVLNAGSGEGG